MATSTLGNGTLVLAGTTSGTTTVTATAVAGTTTLTLPAATDTLVGRATTDTLTNKTLTGAAMNGTLGATTASTVAATTLTTSSTVTHNGGTANGVPYLNGSKVLTTGSALVFDGTNLGVGVTPSAWKTTKRAMNLFSANGLGLSGGDYESQVTNNCYDASGGWTRIGAAYGAGRYEQFNGAHIFYGDAAGASGVFTPSTRMTLDNAGNLLVGTTSTIGSTAGILVANSGANVQAITTNSTSSSAYYIGRFYSGGTEKGYIYFDGTNVSYTNLSDYRLKENVQPMQNALDKVAQLNPVTYNWKSNGKAGQGFIAHELQAFVPDCVTGDKDAVDEDGNPKYQGIDTSFLVATLTAAIKEQSALITQLTARITALESA